MGWLKNLFAEKKPVSGKVVCLVDGMSLGRVNGNQGKLSPGDQIQLVRRLGRFTEKEQVPIIVGYSGEALRKIADGDRFEGVTVHFAGSADRFSGMMQELYRKAGGHKKALLITDDVALENEILSAGGRTLRASTFRKVLQGSTGTIRESRRSNRPRRPRPKRPAPPSPENDNGVSELIDLVD